MKYFQMDTALLWREVKSRFTALHIQHVADILVVSIILVRLPPKAIYIALFLIDHFSYHPHIGIFAFSQYRTNEMKLHSIVPALPK